MVIPALATPVDVSSTCLLLFLALVSTIEYTTVYQRWYSDFSLYAIKVSLVIMIVFILWGAAHAHVWHVTINM